MTDKPEKRSLTEPLDIQWKIEDTLAGRRPIEKRKYPHFMPDYEIPFLHIGTQKQLFLDNFIIDHLEDVERVFPEPHRPAEPILEVGDLPWEIHYNPFPSGAIQDPEDGKFKMWYNPIPVPATRSTPVKCYVMPNRPTVSTGKSPSATNVCPTRITRRPTSWNGTPRA